MLIIFIIYVQSRPQKPKECCMASLIFYYLQRLCHYAFSVFTSGWFLQTFMWRYTQIRCSDSGNLSVWPKSELNQSGFDPGFCCSKGSCFSLKAALRVCSVTMCCFKDSLAARNREGCLKEMSSSSRGTFNP